MHLAAFDDLWESSEVPSRSQNFTLQAGTFFRCLHANCTNCCPENWLFTYLDNRQSWHFKFSSKKFIYKPNGTKYGNVVGMTFYIKHGFLAGVKFLTQLFGNYVRKKIKINTHSCNAMHFEQNICKVKVKIMWIYIVHCRATSKALRHGWQFYLQITPLHVEAFMVVGPTLTKLSSC